MCSWMQSGLAAKPQAGAPVGGAMRVGWHTIKTWSSTQATLALSSGESELYALTKGASQALGLLALAKDFGTQLNAKIHPDASATLGIVNREGLGKLRHVKVQYLWLQERVRGKDLKIFKVPGKENPADLMTENLNAYEMEYHLDNLGVERRSNRADMAPKVASGQVLAAVRGPRPADGWRQEDNNELDGKVKDCVVRLHSKPRLELFTPMRVCGSPPRLALTAMRRTVGRYIDNAEQFEVIDEWTKPATAHRNMRRHWTGETTFYLKRSS